MRKNSQSSFLSAYGLDRAADAMWDVVLVWAAAHSGSATNAALIMACGVIPQVVVTLVGGAVADRIGLYRTASITLWARTAILALFAVVTTTHEANVAAIAAIATVIGLIDAVHMPAMSGIPGLLAVHQGVIQGQVQTIGRLASLVGTPLAGPLIGWSLGGAGGASAVLTACAAGVLIANRRDAVASGHPISLSSSAFSDTRAGVSYMWHSQSLRLSLLIFAAANFFSTSPMLLGFGLKAKELGWTGLTYGVVFGSVAAGGVLGSILLSKFATRIQNPLPSACISLFATGAIIGLLSASRAAEIVAACGFLAGLVAAPGLGLLMGHVRELTDPSMLGRVMAATQVATFSFIPLGHLAYGALVRQSSVSTAGVAMGASLSACAIAALSLRRRRNVERAVA